MPLSQTALKNDIRLASAKPVTRAFGDSDRFHQEREELAAAIQRLTKEVERLRDENQSLRESAEIWIRMYENQLSRANRASELLAHCAQALR